MTFVPQKGKPVYPSKWATCLSLEKGNLFPNKGNLFVSQPRQPVCPSKSAAHLFIKTGIEEIRDVSEGRPETTSTEEKSQGF